MEGKPLFQEVQHFKDSWIWYLMLGITSLALFGVAIGALYLESQDEMVGLTIAASVTTLVAIIISTSKLSVRIDEDAIHYKYPPFQKKEILHDKNDIKELYVREYKPIREYGGYGYRYRLKSGRALSVGGNIGLQIVLKNGKRILIGTNKPDSMRTVVRRLKEKWEMNG